MLTTGIGEHAIAIQGFRIMIRDGDSEASDVTGTLLVLFKRCVSRLCNQPCKEVMLQVSLL